MKTSLVITTYNWKDALKRVIESALDQIVLPDEIIVADDGSRDDTRDMLEQLIPDCPVPLIHSWQPDKGFRAAASRNQAIAKASGDYIVIVDGDMLLHPAFIGDHARLAQRGCFIQGSRVLLSASKTQAILNGLPPSYSFLQTGIKNRINAIYSSGLSLLLSKKSQQHRGIKSCNMSFFKTDCEAVNGFNEDFIGWGREDSEFVERLYNVGLQRHNVKCRCVAYHLFHDEQPRSSLPQNDALLKQAMDKKLDWCVNGIDKYSLSDGGGS